MTEIGGLYHVEGNGVPPPKRYLGADIKIIQLQSGIECWAMSSDSYVREAIANVEILLEKDGKKWSRPKSPPPIDLPAWIGYITASRPFDDFEVPVAYLNYALGLWIGMP